ncbi:MAG: methyltransferase [Pseudomonadota bacterium]
MALVGPETLPGWPSRLADALRRWRDARISDPRFQAWAAAFPLTRGLVRRRSAALHQIVSGFVQSQVLAAAVELDLFKHVSAAPLSAGEIAAATGLPPDGARRLAQAAAALDFLVLRRDGRYGLGPLGAVMIGAPGLMEIVRHHRLFYKDLADPVALLRGPETTALSQFWAYVAPDEGGGLPEAAAAYSRVMTETQAMVAAETLATGALHGVRHLLDIGGGEGAFVSAALANDPALRGTVFDLKPVAELAAARLSAAGLSTRATAIGGSFRTDPLPTGADAVSLIRVAYDHSDATVAALLARIFDHLPPGGRLILSEPMSGGDRPSLAGDVYFGMYTAAMTSGTPRSAAAHTRLLQAAGFVSVRTPRTRNPMITSVVTARKPNPAAHTSKPQ